MTLALLLFLYPAQTLTLPQSAMAGATVELTLKSPDGSPLSGAVIRALGPALRIATVNAVSLNVRIGPSTSVEAKGLVYRGERLLVIAEMPDGWCEAVVSNGSKGFVSCAFLDLQPYGQPFGETDAAGHLETTSLAVVPIASLAVGAFVGEDRVASATISIRPFEYEKEETIAPGITYRERRWVANEDGPWTMQILAIDPHHPGVNLLPVRAKDQAIGREEVSSMARRYGATAGVNAGYFVTTGAYQGGSAGVYQLNREVVSGGVNRTALIWCAEQDFVEHPLIDVVNFNGRVLAAGGVTANLLGVNKPRSDSQDLTVYSPLMGGSTLTNDKGVEAALDRNGRVLSVEDGKGNLQIPRDGKVLSGTGAGATFLRQRATVGAILLVEMSLQPVREACAIEDVIGGGPRMIRAGKPDVTAENFAHVPMRHPRTVFAVTGRGTFLLITLDGRQASSAGMRMDELADELIRLDVVDAMNLDGGGSSTMVVRGDIRNVPSDGVERAVSDGLLVFSINSFDELRSVVEAIAQDEKQIPAAARESLQTASTVAEFKVRLEDAAPSLSASVLRILREGGEGIKEP